MNHRNRIVELTDELSNMAADLQEALDTLNYHSLGEAVHDIRGGAVRIAERMRTDILTLLRLLEANGYLKDSRADETEIAEIEEMNELLDVLRKVSVETKSYHHFIDVLIPLMKLLDKWAMNGLAPVPGLSADDE